jgi:hypothetical protein
MIERGLGTMVGSTSDSQIAANAATSRSAVDWNARPGLVSVVVTDRASYAAGYQRKISRPAAIHC